MGVRTGPPSPPNIAPGITSAKIVIIVVIAAILLVIYVGIYLHLRMSLRLVHRSSIGGPNLVVPGDFNPGIFLFAPDPLLAAQRHDAESRLVVNAMLPLIWLECRYHDCFYICTDRNVSSSGIPVP